MEVLRLIRITVLAIVLLQLSAIEDTIAFKDLMTDPDTFSNLETNEEVRLSFFIHKFTFFNLEKGEFHILRWKKVSMKMFVFIY